MVARLYLLWALSYLEQANLVESDGANAYRITQTGQHQLGTSSPIEFQIDPHAEVSIPIANQNAVNIANIERSESPLIVIRQEFEHITDDLKRDLLQKICNQDPKFFENLIIDLLLAMGYGNRRRDLASHMGRTGDGGIDGAINQDQLGLDVVYIQAKRYKLGSSVPVSAVRDFVGAIEAHKANKGVFVTTSKFTKSAKVFIDKISKRIVLIDGERLSELLIRNNIGVKIKETFEIKRIDEDYFS